MKKIQMNIRVEPMHIGIMDRLIIERSKLGSHTRDRSDLIRQLLEEELARLCGKGGEHA